MNRALVSNSFSTNLDQTVWVARHARKDITLVRWILSNARWHFFNWFYESISRTTDCKKISLRSDDDSLLGIQVELPCISQSISFLIFFIILNDFEVSNKNQKHKDVERNLNQKQNVEIYLLIFVSRNFIHTDPTIQKTYTYAIRIFPCKKMYDSLFLYFRILIFFFPIILSAMKSYFSYLHMNNCR